MRVSWGGGCVAKVLNVESDIHPNTRDATRRTHDARQRQRRAFYIIRPAPHCTHGPEGRVGEAASFSLTSARDDLGGEEWRPRR